MDIISSTKQRLISNRIISDSGCWEWQKSRTKHGYGQTSFRNAEGRYWQLIQSHRLAAHLWLGLDLDSDLCALHHCDNPPCFNPDHLYIGTRAQNMKDARDRGRARFEHLLPYNEAKKVKPETRRRVLELLADGYTTRATGAALGITHTTVRRIRNEDS